MRVALAKCLRSTAVITNLLTNPGFETGNFAGWTVGGQNGGYGVATDGTALPVTSAIDGSPDLYFPSRQNVHSGDFAAYGITAGDSQEGYREYVSFSQKLSLAPGRYELGFYLGTDNTPGGTGLTAALDSGHLGIYVDGHHVPFETLPPFDFHGGSGPMDFVLCNAEVSLAGGPHNIGFHISGSGTGRVGMSMDDAFVAAVPEPGTVGLLLLGGAVLVFVQRRSRP